MGAVNNRLRLKLGFAPADWLAFDCEYDVSPRIQDARLFGPGLFAPGAALSGYRLTDLRARLYPGPGEAPESFAVFHNLDRLMVTIKTGPADIVVGRQPIAWGSARIVNPTDLLAPFAFNELDKEERTGVDALRVALEDRAGQDMLADGLDPARVTCERSLDCRYQGQSYEIEVPYRRARTVGAAFLEAFHRRHKRLYSYRHDGRPVEVVNIRVKAVAVTPKLPLVREPRAASLDPAALVRKRKIHTGRAVREGAVYDRARLRHGNAVAGPALIIDPESTTYLPPGYAARVGPYLDLVIRKAGAR